LDENQSEMLIPLNRWKDSGYRVTKKALLFVARKNGKTALAASLALCCAIADKENGAEVDIVANNAKQAEICYEQTKNYAESIDPKGKSYSSFLLSFFRM